MAKAIVTKKPTPATPEKPAAKANPLADAKKTIGAALNQMQGLHAFLRALGEAAERGGVVDVNDLCFGFDYLLDATIATTERARDLIIQAGKGGAA